MKKNLTFLFIFPLILGMIKVNAFNLSSALKNSQELLEKTALETGASLSQNDDLILKLYQKGFTIHKTWLAFSPDKTIRRDEAAKMLTFALDFLPQPSGFIQAEECSFKDLDKARFDLRSLLVQSCEEWLFKGSKGFFRPNESITNGQIMTVLGRMLFGTQPERGGHYARNYVKLLEEKNYLSDPSLINEKSWDWPAKRATLAELLAKVLED